MGKGVFKKVIANGGKPLAEPFPEKKADAPASVPATKKRGAVQGPLYGDVDVCRALRIHRRAIAAARIRETLGVNWGFAGLHAGMTTAWVSERAKQSGIDPEAALASMKPIEENDGVVSCKLVSTWPNAQRVTAEIVATGERKIVTVPDSGEMCLDEIFDCRVYGAQIAWEASVNQARY